MIALAAIITLLLVREMYAMYKRPAEDIPFHSLVLRREWERQVEEARE